MITNILYVAIGGALGASFRFIVSNFLKNYFAYFPVGTLFVNVLGSLLIGVLANYLNPNSDETEATTTTSNGTTATSTTTTKTETPKKTENVEDAFDQLFNS